MLFFHAFLTVVDTCTLLKWYRHNTITLATESFNTFLPMLFLNTFLTVVVSKEGTLKNPIKKLPIML